jgi:starch phosphorylase
LKEIKSD